ncbi:MAG: SAM-dependent methyltransferase [Candidatus Dadabacteria bacterium]|nr:MAG: SAM-dependent methyltransferase [Candidatus Dadabacteria bacterium]
MSLAEDRVDSGTIFDAKSGEPWPVKLFKRSPLKQKKLAMIMDMIGSLESKVCLDIGSDNGVISYFLRQAGGKWYSADLIPETVESIRSLVGERVEQISPESVPYADSFFDLIVIVDFLEHIEDDRKFIEELFRVIKPGGELIVIVPNPKEGLLRKFRFAIGQTDEAHGHLRPGYSREELEALLNPYFNMLETRSFSRLFSVLVDTLITFALDLLKGKAHTRKGNVVTGGDLSKLKKSFRFYSLLYPFIAFFVKLDDLFFWLHGNMLIARTKRSS